MLVNATYAKITATIYLEEDEIGFLRKILFDWAKGMENPRLGFGGQLLNELKRIPTPNYNKKFPGGVINV